MAELDVKRIDMSNPLISVIIPNYCHAQYLDQRIQSVLNQTYDNFEIIILDDCSPDDGASRAVIEKYRENSHVSHIVYNETNSGSTFIQWNKGIELSKGDYCWIAESDDFCEPNFLETLVAQVMSYPDVSVAYCIPQFVDKEGQLIRPIPESEQIKIIKGDDFVRTPMSYTNAVWNASAVIFKREYVLEIDNCYMDYVAAGDRLFWALLAKKGNVVHVPKRLSWFRQHGNEVSPAKKRQGTTGREDYRIVRYMEQHGWLNWLESIRARHIYLLDVERFQYDNETIRQELLNQWSYNGKMPIRLIHLIGRCYMSYLSRVGRKN